MNWHVTKFIVAIFFMQTMLKFKRTKAFSTFTKSVVGACCFFLLAESAKAQILMMPYAGNPVIPLSQPNPGTWNDPSVIKLGNEYWMYITSKNGTSSMFDGKVVPYLMKSTDKVNWVLHSAIPLLLNSNDTSAWDYEGVETPEVIYFDSLYHMYYTAVPGTGRFAIGHATSNDGLNWIKDTIILTPSNIASDWMSYQVAEPGVTVFNNQLYLYFTGTGARPDTTYPGGKAVIGLIKSNDGFTFTTPVKVLEQNEIYPPALGYYGYSTPSPVIINNHVHLFYDVAQELPQWTQVAIHHAYSNDGINSFIQDTAAIFTKDDFAWTKREIRSPDVLLDSNKLMMWFAGDNIFVDTSWGIGYAEALLPFTHIKNTYNKKESIVIFPNPAYEVITIKSIDIVMGKGNVKIFNCEGILVKEFNNEYNQPINISDLLPGIYVVYVNFNKFKLVKL